MESEFQIAARQKWPTAIITGDGPYALWCEALDHVWLHAHYMTAMAEIALDHSNFHCKDGHRMIELTPVHKPRTIFLKERD